MCVHVSEKSYGLPRNWAIIKLMLFLSWIHSGGCATKLGRFVLPGSDFTGRGHRCSLWLTFEISAVFAALTNVPKRFSSELLMNILFFSCISAVAVHFVIANRSCKFVNYQLYNLLLSSPALAVKMLQII